MSEHPAAVHAFAAAKLAHISATYAVSALLCAAAAIIHAPSDLLRALFAGARRVDLHANRGRLLRSGSSAAGPASGSDA